jgi:multidrug efflux pump subunit AcrA (membrane-fusion protein)
MTLPDSPPLSLTHAEWESALVALEQAGKVLPWEQWTKRCLELVQRLLPIAQVNWVESEQLGEAWSTLRTMLTATGEPQLLTKLTGRTGWGVAWQIENQSGTLLQIEQLPLTDVPEETQHFLLAIAEVATDAQRRFILRTVQSRATSMLDLWRRSSRWQQQSTLASIAQAVALELNDLLQAGRTTLLIKQGKQWRVLASNTGQVPRNVTELAQQQITLARQLAEHPESATWGELPLPLANRSDLIPQPLQVYIDQQAVKGVLLIPWEARHGESLDLQLPTEFQHTLANELPTETAAEPIIERGAVLCEWFQSAPISTVSLPLLARLLQSGATAVEQARRVESLPGLSFMRRLRAWQQRGVTWPRIALLGCLLLGIALLCWPVTFAIHAPGRAWPVQRRELFAPEEATVQRVLVEHGQTVAVGDPLLELTSLPLQQERTELRGELASIKQRLSSLQAERLKLNPSTASDQQRADQLTAEEAELQTREQNRQAQLQIIDQRIQTLTIKSPLAGRVLTWNLQQALTGQPVQRGQALLTLANTTAEWQTELRIPATSLGYIQSAVAESTAPLSVEIRAPMAPTQRWSGTLLAVSERSEVDPLWGAGTAATTTFESHSATSLDQRLSPGTEVRVSIDCGTRPWGFVLFRDVIDAVRRWW